MSDSVQPHRQQPTRLCCPWDSPGKNTVVGCHFVLQCMKVKRQSEVAQLCPTLCNPMDCSLRHSSVHGDSPGRNTEVGCHFLFQGSFPIQDQTRISSVSCMGRQVLYWWATRKAPSVCGLDSFSLIFFFFELFTLCSCLENPRDGGAWCAAVHGVAQSWTRLKRLSSRSSSIADLQCCDSFSWTGNGLSHTYTCIHSPPN